MEGHASMNIKYSPGDYRFIMLDEMAESPEIIINCHSPFYMFGSQFTRNLPGCKKVCCFGVVS